PVKREDELDKLLRDLPAMGAWIWSQPWLIDDDTKVAKRVAWLNKFGHLAQPIDWPEVADLLDSLKVPQAMVLLQELEMQGNKVADPTDFIKRAVAVAQVEGDEIEPAGSAVTARIAELNESGTLAAPIDITVGEDLARLPESDALELLQEVARRGAGVKNPTGAIRFKSKARLAVLDDTKILKMLRLAWLVWPWILVRSQDPATMATAMAGQVAGMVASKAEQKIEDAISHPEQPVPCIGTSCCAGSTCMRLPGMGCKANRGQTQCVGSSALAMTEGVCQCMKGPCNQEGICVETLPPEEQKNFLPPAPPPGQVLTDRPGASAGNEGGGIPVIPIAIGLVVANVVIWGTIWIIKQRRSGYSAFSSDDEEPPTSYKGNRRFQGPGH
ncbi:unnamed protein product, partial [Effrenium voratum]